MIPVKLQNTNMGQSSQVAVKTGHQIKMISTQLYDVCCSDYNTMVLTDAGDIILTGGNDKGQLGVKTE
jgi:hypothetical protein